MNWFFNDPALFAQLRNIEVGEPKAHEPIPFTPAFAIVICRNMARYANFIGRRVKQLHDARDTEMASLRGEIDALRTTIRGQTAARTNSLSTERRMEVFETRLVDMQRTLEWFVAARDQWFERQLDRGVVEVVHTKADGEHASSPLPVLARVDLQAAQLYESERRLATLERELAQMKSAPPLSDHGVWKDGEHYPKGAGVTWDGSFWIAQRATSDKPGTTDGFRLAVKRGRDAKDRA